MSARRSAAPWLITWTIMAVIAVATGIATRLSYTDVSHNQHIIDDMVYAVAPYSEEEADRIAEGFEGLEPRELAETADVVVIASKEGSSEYRYKAFLTSLEVKGVIKGSGLAAGSRINLFEPVGIYERPSGRALVPSGAYLLGGTPLRSGADYILFLKRAPKTSGVDGYTLVNSPYAKMPVDEDFPSFLADSEENDLRFEKCAAFDVIARDQSSLDHFRLVQKETLRYVAKEGEQAPA